MNLVIHCIHLYYGTSCRRCSRSALGNIVSGHYFCHFFLFLKFFFLLRHELFSQKKNLYSKRGSKWPITLGQTPFQTPSAFWGPLSAILDFDKRNVPSIQTSQKQPWCLKGDQIVSMAPEFCPDHCQLQNLIQVGINGSRLLSKNKSKAPDCSP